MFLRNKPLIDLACNEDLNVITFPTHGRYQGNWATLPYKFWMLNIEDGPTWNLKNTPRIPQNHNFISDVEDKQGILLSQSRAAHFSFMDGLQKRFNTPHVCLEHVVPTPEVNDKSLLRLRRMNGDINVFIGEKQKEAWNLEGEVIEHGIDTDFWSPGLEPGSKRLYGTYILTVVNEYRVRGGILGFETWEKFRNKGFNMAPVGHTPGLSEHQRDKELLLSYRNSAVFLNTSLYSPIPTSLLEAMSCGCLVLTKDNWEMSTIIENGKNGFISNDDEELMDIAKKAVESPDDYLEVRRAARETILNRFNLNKHLNKWIDILEKARTL